MSLMRKHRNLVIVGAGFLILFVFMQGTTAPAPTPQPAPAPATQPVIVKTEINPTAPQAVLSFIVDACPKVGDCKATVIKSETALLEAILKLVPGAIFQGETEMDRYVFRVRLEPKMSAEVSFTAFVDVRVIDVSVNSIVYAFRSDTPAVNKILLAQGKTIEPYSYTLPASELDKNLKDGPYTLNVFLNIASGRHVYKAEFTQAIDRRSAVVVSTTDVKSSGTVVLMEGPVYSALPDHEATNCFSIYGKDDDCPRFTATLSGKQIVITMTRSTLVPYAGDIWVDVWVLAPDGSPVNAGQCLSGACYIAGSKDYPSYSAPSNVGVGSRCSLTSTIVSCGLFNYIQRGANTASVPITRVGGNTEPIIFDKGTYYVVFSNEDRGELARKSVTVP